MVTGIGAVSIGDRFNNGRFPGLLKGIDNGQITCQTVVRQEGKLIPKFDRCFGEGNGRPAYEYLLDLAAIRTGARF